VKVRVCYTVNADNDYRMAIRHSWGQCGTLATRQEVKDYCERVGSAEDDDLMQEWRDCETGCQS
jgi:hypothetical protein